MDAHYDVVVVGAGLQGLAAAKTFLQIEPGLNLVILDSAQTVGGTWAKENLYPELRSNNLLGTYEYTDFPMTDQFGVKREEHIPGQVIHDYLQQYVDMHSLSRRMQLGAKVKIAEKIEEGWKLHLEMSGLQDDEKSTAIKHQIVTCTKLIVASGLLSSPRPIDIPIQPGFKAPVVNFARFRQEATPILSDPTIQHVAVIGGSKAAYDAVYLFASHGKRVSWIIRASGHGPTYMAHPHVYLGPFRCWLEKLTSTRFFTLFSPCVWGQFDGFGFLRSMLHGTSAGRWLIHKFWTKLTSDLIVQTELQRHDELKKLIPNHPAFWYGNGLSVFTYPTNIQNYITNGQVDIMRRDIRCLEKAAGIVLQDGNTLEVDAVVCCTGWQVPPNIKFLPESIHSDLGIPSAALSDSEHDMWSKLDQRADLEILNRFPYLASGPLASPTQWSTPGDSALPGSDSSKVDKLGVKFPRWRLWRGMAPPGLADRSIVFLGMLLNLQSAVRSEISSLWAYAYLYNRLDNMDPISTAHLETKESSPLSDDLYRKERQGSRDSVLYDTALFNRFGRWRYPMGYGAQLPDIVFDGIPYLDLLLHDLGLRSWRKGWSWLGELFGGSYGQEDYRGLVEEWLAKEHEMPHQEGVKIKSS